jgi:hypothetical protein
LSSNATPYFFARMTLPPRSGVAVELVGHDTVGVRQRSPAAVSRRCDHPSDQVFVGALGREDFGGGLEPERYRDLGDVEERPDGSPVHLNEPSDIARSRSWFACSLFIHFRSMQCRRRIRSSAALLGDCLNGAATAT